ncbi:MAG: HupE/UreJ family protein [Saprospiraceae bacterium]|nr:HupE/UreJ family protein [Saprospiraceae bacterium]
MFEAYFKLGFEHILDINGLDHVLFLLALTMPFSLKDWKRVIILATAFTVGHSVTLALSALDIIKVNSDLIEILIALSIFITALLQIIKKQSDQKLKKEYGLALLFGFIHGMGFSNFFKSILGKDNITIPLLSFNIGVEMAQILIVLAIITFNTAVFKYLKNRGYWVYTVGGLVCLWSLKLIVERL